MGLWLTGILGNARNVQNKTPVIVAFCAEIMLGSMTDEEVVTQIGSLDR
jgi:hypothetical protein